MAHVVPSSSNPMPSSPNQDPHKSRKDVLDDTGFSGVLGRFHGGATPSSRSGSNAYAVVIAFSSDGKQLAATCESIYQITVADNIRNPDPIGPRVWILSPDIEAQALYVALTMPTGIDNSMGQAIR